MLRQQRAQRATWLELDEPPRRALQIRRPGEEAIAGWRAVFEVFNEGDSDKSLATLPKLRDIARSVVVDWRGFTEADLLGEAIGASSPQSFDLDVFSEWVDDETLTLVNIASHAARAFTEYRDKKAAAEKN